MNKRTLIDKSAHNQRLEILKWFRTHNSLTTLEARNELGIMHPGGRVLELRKQGYRITTFWTTEYDVSSQAHRVARYVLLNGRSQWTE